MQIYGGAVNSETPETTRGNSAKTCQPCLEDCCSVHGRTTRVTHRSGPFSQTKTRRAAVIISALTVNIFRQTKLSCRLRARVIVQSTGRSSSAKIRKIEDVIRKMVSLQ
ncbi:hypothetical protein KCU65_g39, partial [Aureobasidium melanogenum]